MAKTIAVAMIVKNEEALLARCLDSVKEADAIYILDTGSQDKTVEIARRYTNNVFLDYIWADDFSEAQNLVKSRVKEDWILSIDADEYLDCSFDEVRKAIELAKDVVRVTMSAEGGEKLDFAFGRVFRNTPDIYWCQAIHKHLNVPGEGEPIGNVRIVYGHSPAHRMDPDRSLRMLEQAVANEKHPVRNLYYLGREYYYKQRYKDAITTFERYFKVAHSFPEAADAHLIVAQCYEALGMANECADSVLQAIKINPNFKEAVDYMAELSIDENKSQWERMSRSATNRGVLWVRTVAERAFGTIFLAPHNDDESLFGAFTLMREKPLVVVVTDSYIQPNRGDAGCDAETRRQETIDAMALAGCPVVFLGIKDTELTEALLIERLKSFCPDKVYAPAVQGGNVQHDIVGRVAKQLFGKRCEFYTTYTQMDLYTTGKKEVVPTQKEMELKDLMLSCYTSQLTLPSTLPHFNAVRRKSEWLTSGLRKIVIMPYFGVPPDWFEKFQVPAGYDWIIDTDIEGFKRRVREKLGIEYTGEPGTGKVWDFRCALGLLYEDEIRDYDFWGHCDFDVVFGDVDKFVPDSSLDRLDVYSSHNQYVCGCFSLYRNTPEVNNLFKKFQHWQLILSTPEATGWVEREYSHLLENSGLRYAYDFQQGNPWTATPELIKNDAKLFQVIDGAPVEIMFFHFRHSKKWPL